jgi:hypothetical protein
VALVLGAELLDQLNKVELRINVRLIWARTQREPAMGRPRKPASELTDKEVLRKLFPVPVREEVRKAAKPKKKSTKKDTR